MKRLIHRNEPNRPHISSVTNNFKERRNKTNRCAANLVARPPFLPLFICHRHEVRRVGEGVSMDQRHIPQEVFTTNPKKFSSGWHPPQNLVAAAPDTAKLPPLPLSDRPGQAARGDDLAAIWR